MVKGQEQLTFVRAADEYAAHPGNQQSITDMIRLALEGNIPDISQRASDWLLRNVGVKVVDCGGINATQAAAAGIC